MATRAATFAPTRWALLGLTAALVTAAPAARANDEAENSKVTTRVTPQGEVVAQVKLAAKPAAVRAVLASAEKSHGLAPTTVDAKAEPDGSCERVKLKTRGLLEPFVVETRRCPTSTGWKETLVASKNFLEYWNEWTVQESGEGSMVIFKTRTIPNVMVPEAILLSETRRVVAKLLRNLSAAVGDR